MRRRPISALTLVAVTFGAAVVIVAVHGCEEKRTETPTATAAPTGVPALPSGAAAAPASGVTVADSGSTVAAAKGIVKGTVVLTGKVPEMPEQKRQTDAFCAKTPQKDDEVVVGKGGALANVIVRINGLPSTPAPAKPAELNQDKCSYSPRVQAIVAGQTLQIKNSDPVLHNVREIKGALTKKNMAQVPGTPAVLEQDLKDPGTLMKFKCDIHQWMTAYVWVQNNGAFAVSDKDGKFEIANVPAGTWDVTAWHERFGEKNAKITIGKDQTAELKLDFAAK